MPRFLRVLFLVPFLFLPTIARADSVPALTIISGTINGGRIFGAGRGITFSLIGIDPATGKIYKIEGGGEGGSSSDPFLAVAGQMATISASISGTLDLGSGNVEGHVGGTSPVIPDVMDINLDLQGTAGASLRGTFFSNLAGIPLFTIDQSLSGTAVFHFIIIAPGDPRYELKSVTITIAEPVPEPASVILLVTSLTGLGLFSKRRKRT